MAEKCAFCSNKIEETFLGKIQGTIVKINIGGKNKLYYVCNKCQKEHKDLKAELSRK